MSRQLAQVQSNFGHAMRKAALLYNPDSGGRGVKRKAQLESVLALFRGASVEAELILPDSQVHAKDMTRQAIDSGCDTVFACGGDGTIHNIVQVLAKTNVALAVLPMGTANALAHDLGLPMNVVAAARALLRGVSRRIALGHIRCLDMQSESVERYFIITAGAGVDAHLFYKLMAATKHRLGMAAYYAKAWQLWFNYPMTKFQVEFAESGLHQMQRAEVTELMAIRIRNFGGVLRELAPGASLQRNDLRVVACRTSSRLAFLSYVTRGLLGRSRSVAGIDLFHSQRVSCTYISSSSNASKIYVEADGELIGTLPAEITVVPDALTVLMPAA